MTAVTVQGREFNIDFHYASQGHRITVMEYLDGTWKAVPNYDYVLCLGNTQFETLCNLSSDLFDEAVYGEDFARALEIPMITDEDAECIVCKNYYHYSDMAQGHEMLDEIAEQLGATNWDYACIPCYEELAVKVGA